MDKKKNVRRKGKRNRKHFRGKTLDEILSLKPQQ